MGAGMLGRNEGGGEGAELGERGGVAVAGKKASENASNIAIEGGGGDLEGDAGDGAGGVGADAGKFLEEMRVGGQLAAGKADDGLGESVEETSAAIVAQALPVAQDNGEGCAGEGRPVRKAAEPPMVVGQDGGDTGLLAHEF